ncbi:hypothetical protein BDR26DRAFT_923731 [Obelidium mucronatum]|nr:hypothetical protein BDR26DRAFT_923731 [Obelidium mucronatum]
MVRYAIASLAFVSDVKDFVRERADLERDFAKKLETLTKKHALKNEKRSLFSRGGSLGGEKYEDPAGLRRNSVENAWKSILDSTQHRSEAHAEFAESLTVIVCEKLKALIAKKDDARKKHMAFAQRLTAIRDGVYADKDKAKKKYDDACEAVESIKFKRDRCLDDKTREKWKLASHQEVLNMNNKKNLYILEVSAANAAKNRYFTEEIPSLLNDLHCLSESIYDSMKKIWQNYASIESEFLNRSSGDTAAVVLPAIASISPKNDAEEYIRLNPQTAPAMYFRQSPKDFIYIPTVMWKESVGMANDEYSRCYMVNKLNMLRKKLEQIERDLAIKGKGIERMEELYESCKNDPQRGNMEDVFDTILDYRRDCILSDSLKSRIQSNIETIINGVGGEKETDVFHTFQTCSFAIPTTCYYCRQVIWGVGKPGLSCRDCGMNAHIKCELKISPKCTQSKSSMRQVYRTQSAPLPPPPPIPQTNVSKAMSIKSHRKSLTTIASGSGYSQDSSTPSLLPVAEVGSAAIVLYDYTPPPEHASVEEIAVQEGEVVVISELDDGSGWTKVAIRDKIGIIPTAFFQVLNAEEQQHEYTGTATAVAMQEAPPSELPPRIPPLDANDSSLTLQEDGIEARRFNGLIGIKMRVLFDFHQSCDDEISVEAGQDVWVLDEDEGSGWITVHNGERDGLIPSAYLKWSI